MSLDDIQAPATPAESILSAPSNDAPAVAPEAPAADAVDDGADISSELAKVWEKAQGPARDEAGRFKGAEKPEDAPADNVETKAAEEATATEPEKPAAPAVEPPRAWTADQKAKWATLPPDMQSHIAAREQELQNSKTELGRLSAEYKPVADTLTQFKPYLDQVAHGDVAGYLNKMLSASYAMDTNPAGTIKALAEAYGVDLGEIYDPLAEPPNQELVQLRAENARLKAAQEAAQSRSAANQQAAEQEATSRIVQEFYDKHPDAREMEDEFAAQITAVRTAEPNLSPAAILEKAYEKAAWAHPAMREKRLAAAQQDAEAKRIAAAKEAAAKAKQAAGVNVQGSPNPNSEPDDPTDQLRAIWRKRHAA